MWKSAAPFADRKDAGRFLAGKLAAFAGKDPVVEGLARGGVVVAAEIARGLRCGMDVIIAGKLRAPDNPELAIGAIAEDGTVYLNNNVIKGLGVSREYLESEKAGRLEAVRAKLALYRKVKEKTPIRGKTVIIVDDGLATGSTMIAAVQAAHASGAKEIVAAVPGGPLDTVNRLRSMPEITEVVCPVVPELFFAVSQLYLDFRQTEDDEVAAILRELA
ncbi:MAG: phosphoribosyltransferase [Deltaproteobacteria bacterium]|nr:phosphoribosyltransferase [Deltaproteobacteria bacterium]